MFVAMLANGYTRFDCTSLRKDFWLLPWAVLGFTVTEDMGANKIFLFQLLLIIPMEFLELFQGKLWFCLLNEKYLNFLHRGVKNQGLYIWIGNKGKERPTVRILSSCFC